MTRGYSCPVDRDEADLLVAKSLQLDRFRVQVEPGNQTVNDKRPTADRIAVFLRPFRLVRSISVFS